jgi:molecular chaperone GrpE
MTAFDEDQTRGAAVPPEDEPVTARDDPGEPAGEEDPRNEAQRVAETERVANGGAAGGGEPAGGGHPDVDAGSTGEPEDDLSRAQRERDEYLDLARRAQADFENYRKRAARETAAAGERARSGLVRELLPVVDNLERALLSAGDGEQHLAEGVKLVHSELVAVLERNGVEQFDPAGEPFDPAVHEALSTRSQDGAAPGLVLDVLEKGYRTNGTVIRPARVIVSG